MKRTVFNIVVGLLALSVLYVIVYRDLRFYYAFSDADLVEAEVVGKPTEAPWNPLERDKSLSHQQTRKSYHYPLLLDTTDASGERISAYAELVGRTFKPGDKILVYYTSAYPDYVVVKEVLNFQLKRASLEGWLVLVLILVLAFSFYYYQWRNWQHRRYVENICVEMSGVGLNIFKLDMVPEEQRPFVRRVNLSHNELRTIPLNADQLHQVRILNLSHNRFEELPVILEKFKYLEKLDLSHNPLKTIELRWRDLKYLKEVDLGGCPLESIPTSLMQLSEVKIHLPEHLED